MKPSMTRWKTVPLKYGSFTLRPDRGSVHSFEPSASPVKFATVFGVSASNSRAVKFPSLVVKCAYTIVEVSKCQRSASAISSQQERPAESRTLTADSNTMPKSYRYLHYDVFTDHLFGGNQLAVFLDGRGLSTETMQAIAKEMNFSETTFVLPPERRDTPGIPDIDVRMRIFTPGEELPAAGHPTIGSTFALARTGVIDPHRDRFVFGLGIGPVPVTLTWKDDDLSFAWMTQKTPTFGEPIADK